MNAAELQNPLIISTPRTAGLVRGFDAGRGRFGNGVKCKARGLDLYLLLLFMNMCVRIMRDLPSAVRPGPYVAKRNTVTSICTRVMRFGTLSHVLAVQQGLRNQGVDFQLPQQSLTVKAVRPISLGKNFLMWIFFNGIQI